MTTWPNLSSFSWPAVAVAKDFNNGAGRDVTDVLQECTGECGSGPVRAGGDLDGGMGHTCHYSRGIDLQKPCHANV